MNNSIRLTVPATIEYRDVAVRCVAAACRLATGKKLNPERKTLDLSEKFDAELVSGFSELFNNIIKHSYGGTTQGEVSIVINAVLGEVTIHVSDMGSHSLNWEEVPEPELASLPEGGMGLYILKSFIDEIEYEAGPPNHWRLTKRVSSAAETVTE